ncbi:DUF3592 domain-containing protein [Yeosuana marina]|uniref:DUF3592 domain-containing protein n=1 Tax=Yeosuana marina TaxID=1565536 RepID=UPI001421EA2A|nr:DUF3592 domain-containing protein [Yeosuana marina]
MRYKYEIQNTWFFLLIPIAIIVSFKFSDLPWINEFRTLIPIVAVGIILVGYFSRKLRSKRLKKVGVSATAEILDVKEIGMYDSRYNPQIKVYLKVKPRYTPAYEKHFSGFFSKMDIHKLQKGNVLWVKYDPNNPKKVIIDAD